MIVVWVCRYTSIVKSRAAARQRRVSHKIVMSGNRIFGRRQTTPGSVGSKLPGLGGILEVHNHNLIQHLCMNSWVTDRHQTLDPPVHVAFHPVGRADEDLRISVGQLMPVAKHADAAMFQEATDDGLDTNILRKRPRPQGAGSKCHAQPPSPARPRTTHDIVHRSASYPPGCSSSTRSWPASQLERIRSRYQSDRARHCAL
jgi:hypothetical protein